MKVAVVAHAGKTLGGGLPELRRILEAEGVTDPLWCEVPKSRKAPAQIRRTVAEGAQLVFVWGGDGMVQRAVDVLAGSDVTLAIVPAGTANLFASSLGIPKHIGRAVSIGLRGADRKLDVGRFNGERFAVMAGAGFDAAMIRTPATAASRSGSVAPPTSGRARRTCVRSPFAPRSKSTVSTGTRGRPAASCSATPASSSGASSAFEDARPDDGKLELGVVTAEGLVEWGRIIARAAVGTASKSPFARTTKARSVKVELNRKILYELDGGDRSKVKSFKVKVEPVRHHRARSPRRLAVAHGHMKPTYPERNVE